MLCESHPIVKSDTDEFYEDSTKEGCGIKVKLQLHDAIYRLRFYSNSLIHILSLSNSHNNVVSLQKNRSDKSHRVICSLKQVLPLFQFGTWKILWLLFCLDSVLFSIRHTTLPVCRVKNFIKIQMETILNQMVTLILIMMITWTLMDNHFICF